MSSTEIDTSAGIKVCLIDDDELVREGLKLTLSLDKRIHIHEEYNSGYNLLKNLNSKFNSDVCLIDISLPDISGLDLAKKIIAQKPYIHIIFISAYLSSDISDEAKKLGADFAEKGIKGDILIEKIVNWRNFK